MKACNLSKANTGNEIMIWYQDIFSSCWYFICWCFPPLSHFSSRLLSHHFSILFPLTQPLLSPHAGKIKSIPHFSSSPLFLGLGFYEVSERNHPLISVVPNNYQWVFNFYELKNGGTLSLSWFIWVLVLWRYFGVCSSRTYPVIAGVFLHTHTVGVDCFTYNHAIDPWSDLFLVARSNPTANFWLWITSPTVHTILP